MSNNPVRRTDPLDDFFRGFFVRPVDFGAPSQSTGVAEAPQMRVDVKENAEGYEVHAELPGMKKEDIHVHIDGPVVSITAERPGDRRSPGEREIQRWRARACPAQEGRGPSQASDHRVRR